MLKEYLDKLNEQVKTGNLPEILLVPRGGSLSKYKAENSKIGGKPDWIQNNETPICKKCRVKMQFYGQLGSIGCSNRKFRDMDARLTFGDCGAFYVFACEECWEEFTTIFQGH